MRYIGVEIGGTKLQAMLGSRDGQIDRFETTLADASGGADQILSRLAELLKPLVTSSDVAGIGIGFGGPVDETTGRTIKSHQVAGWEDHPLVDWAQHTFCLPCRIGNDTDLATLAEAALGAGKGKDRVFYSNIGSGIGGGLVDHGRLFTGRHGALELGHTWAYSNISGCDRLENLCSGWALADRARQLANENPDSRLAELYADEPTQRNAERLFIAWQDDCPIAKTLVDDFLDSYARALSNVVALLNPDTLIIGGGVAEVGRPLLSALRVRVQKYAFAPFAENFTVELSQFGRQAVPVGAILLAAS
jgi:glucokinase